MDYVERHREDFEPFFSFGEGEDEEDADFSEYIARMRLDGEWAGNYEIIAAARALDVHIMVHQFKMPAYRTEASKPDAPVVHVSYHDGDHYNSVRDPASPGSSTAGKPRATGARSEAASPEAEAEAGAEAEAEASAEASALSDSMGGLSIAPREDGGDGHDGGDGEEERGADGEAGDGAAGDEARRSRKQERAKLKPNPNPNPNPNPSPNPNPNPNPSRSGRSSRRRSGCARRSGIGGGPPPRRPRARRRPAGRTGVAPSFRSD